MDHEIGTFRAAASDPRAVSANATLSPDGRTLAVGATDGTVSLQDVSRGHPRSRALSPAAPAARAARAVTNHLGHRQPGRKTVAATGHTAGQAPAVWHKRRRATGLSRSGTPRRASFSPGQRRSGQAIDVAFAARGTAVAVTRFTNMAAVVDPARRKVLAPHIRGICVHSPESVLQRSAAPSRQGGCG